MNNRHRIFSSVLAVTIAASLGASASQAADVYLRAESFVTALPGAGNVTMWGYSSCDSTFTTCGAPSSPGPDIVVPAGDSTLTVHLRNMLREPSSIVLLDQAKSTVPVTFVDGQGRTRISAFDVEAAPGGGTQVYTWNSVRSGTHMYQSGSHVQLQVQMGLYGTVVHDAAAGNAYPGVPYARSKTVIFSEVDPLLHGAVTTSLVAESFESPDAANGNESLAASGWVATTGKAGVFDPASAAIVAPTDGEQVGWTTRGGMLSLSGGFSWVPDTSYTLTVDVGDRTDTNFAGYSVGLYAGGVELAKDADALTPDGGFQTRTVTLPANGAWLTGHAGQPVEIRLASTQPAPPPASLTVGNPSLEVNNLTNGSTLITGIDSWSVSTNTGNAGVLDPTATTALPPNPPDSYTTTGNNGPQVGYTNRLRYLFQTLGPIQANTIYTLKVWVGDSNTTDFHGYSVGLYAADGTALAPPSTGPATPAVGALNNAWTEITVNVGPILNPALIGQNLVIRLASNPGTSTLSTARTFFDRVSLSSVTDATRTVFDKVSLTATANGKPANALDRSAHPADGYLPRYFLINGSGTPSDLVTAAPGERILLRLVNAGLQNRAPQLVGGYFEIVGEDGNQAPVVRKQYTTLLPPGKSLDVILVAPSIPGKYALYDRRLGLNNGTGQLGHIVVN
jgi:hypothetical protein